MSFRVEDPGMAKDVTRSHYDRLAASYDQNWAYSPEFTAWMSDRIQDRLKITAGDVAADIGCGTGLYARGLAERAEAVACADPSPAMLAQVPASDRVIPVQASAEDLAAGRAALPHDRYDAILLKESLHHVPAHDRPVVITGLTRLLAAGRPDPGGDAARAHLLPPVPRGPDPVRGPPARPGGDRGPDGRCGAARRADL